MRNQFKYKMLRKSYKKLNTKHFFVWLSIGIVILLFLFSKVIRDEFNFKTKYYSKFETHLNTQQLVLKRGEKSRLYLIGINQKVVFSSSDSTVAIVDIFGNVYAVGIGKTIIYAETKTEVFECLVKVE